MNPIYMLVEHRLNNFLIGLDTNNFSISKPEKCLALKLKLISRGYNVGTSVDNLEMCFCAIKQIIWKNIITYEFVPCQPKNKLYFHMLHNGYKSSYTLMIEIIVCDTLLGKYELIEKINDNMKIMATTIINYMLLLDDIIMNNLIRDLLCVIKQYMFDAMLII